jgi:murein DD-endopeptidase MepM/ murein hydrolase activator NlpD
MHWSKIVRSGRSIVEVQNLMTTYQAHQARPGIDGIALAAFLLIGFGALMVYREIASGDLARTEVEKQVGNQVLLAPAEQAAAEDVNIGSGRAEPSASYNSRMVSFPYDNYTLTQGLHGFSYGHMAIDISAGRGAIVKSPIEGYVSDLYIDPYGNPTLLIENDNYRVTMMHGKYKVAIGDQIALGQMVGRESNLGLTTDMQGRSCRNRDCGYHTHLNIFDKQVGENVDPLKVMK